MAVKAVKGQGHKGRRRLRLRLRKVG